MLLTFDFCDLLQQGQGKLSGNLLLGIKIIVILQNYSDVHNKTPK
jgi:hypothetical protein